MTPDMPPLVRAQNVVRDFALPRRSLLGPGRVFRALHGVSLSIERGESVGLIGESGSGKSTFARLVMGLDRPTAGRIEVAGVDLGAGRAALAAARRHMQMVFQDPYGSLDPRRTVGWSIAEPLAALPGPSSRAERRRLVTETLEAVGLEPEHAARYPHEFSGGQRQRIAIARALITAPDLIVADEPVSALDVSVQAQVLRLMRQLEEARGVTFLFISHDLSVVRNVTRRVAVMYQGRIVETGPTDAVFAAPAHPYTSLLMSAVPLPDPARRRKARHARTEARPELPRGGCPFAPRCPRVQADCREAEPPLAPVEAGRQAACFHPL
ncbi:oligopeptide/dipeptide ABC transporter ATP-binding protein [Lutibaculum baratangense]|uniref:Oligopeptide transport ATP-binding protein OppF n=1 Tax=Lutibaculum baratangense AMV1 TaxID=631454 RepID=V4REM4_9HYPH|nr:ABC transporter ATP-binding protein [Lutibaculum baratangense]ESR24591.1 Oligopeptide transport ATP-binding protein OppF [Lutibaculum baratangense AMV1]